jgi:hypothetical protein
MLKIICLEIQLQRIKISAVVPSSFLYLHLINFHYNLLKQNLWISCSSGDLSLVFNATRLQTKLYVTQKLSRMGLLFTEFTIS